MDEDYKTKISSTIDKLIRHGKATGIVGEMMQKYIAQQSKANDVHISIASDNKKLFMFVHSLSTDGFMDKETVDLVNKLDERSRDLILDLNELLKEAAQSVLGK